MVAHGCVAGNKRAIELLLPLYIPASPDLHVFSLPSTSIEGDALLHISTPAIQIMISRPSSPVYATIRFIGSILDISSGSRHRRRVV